MNATVMLRRFTMAEYHAMGEAGILRADERTEPIDGAIVTLPPIGPGHAEGVRLASRTLFFRLGERCEVSVQNPVALGESDEPRPDIALLHRRAEGYGQAHPGPADILLIIEIADSTLRYDRDDSLPRYAAADIAESWLFNLPGRRIEVHRGPGPDGYRTVTVIPAGGTLSPLAFPDVMFSTLDLLP